MLGIFFFSGFPPSLPFSLILPLWSRSMLIGLVRLLVACWNMPWLVVLPEWSRERERERHHNRAQRVEPCGQHTLLVWRDQYTGRALQHPEDQHRCWCPATGDNMGTERIPLACCCMVSVPTVFQVKPLTLLSLVWAISRGKTAKFTPKYNFRNTH